MALTSNSRKFMQNYNSNHHKEIDYKRRAMIPLSKTQESLRVSNVRGTNQVSYTTSIRRVPLRHEFFTQNSYSPIEKKFVQTEELCKKASMFLEVCEPACNLNTLVNEAPIIVHEMKAKLVDTKMGNAFHPKHKFDFEYSFKQYISQVEWIKRKKIDSYDTNESNVKRRKINTIDKEANPNKSAPVLQNFNTETENHSLPSKVIIFNNRYYLSGRERKDRITHLKRSESTKVVAHAKNVAVKKDGAGNGEELCGVDLKYYFDILDEPKVETNVKIHEARKFDAPQNSEIKVVKQNYNNFTIVPVTKNKAEDKNFLLKGVTKIKGASYTNFNDAKMNNNNVNVIPITKVNSNIIQSNYSNLNILPVTKSEAVLDQFSVNEVPKSKNVLNANSKNAEVNYSDLNTVSVINGEAALDHLTANRVPKNNDASNVNFNSEPVTEKAAMVNKNFQGNEMPKNKSTESINFKVIQVSNDNFSVVPVTAQDVNFKINEETNDSGVFMDHFTVYSKDYITNMDEANEHSLFANRFHDLTIDEFDINLDFLNETKDDFKVNFDQLVNIDDHSDANKSICLDRNQDLKRNCDLATYSALEEFNSFINF